VPLLRGVIAVPIEARYYLRDPLHYAVAALMRGNLGFSVRQ
jgi:hypothetical protein